MIKLEVGLRMKVSPLSKQIDIFVESTFGVSLDVFVSALEMSPGSQGSIAGAISEVILFRHLQEEGFEVLRIKEKPRGGNDEKNPEARGDFYVRRRNQKEDAWLVVESKGLKSNSEFRGSKLDSAEKVLRFLRPRAFGRLEDKRKAYEKGKRTYEKERAKWESTNPGMRFPPFSWDKTSPGPETYDLSGIWESEADLKSWAYSLPSVRFSEDAYRNRAGALAILETHQPSQREAPITRKTQAAPLVNDFSVMAVDLFFRTGKHDFAFMNSKLISHSPSSPEHLYQNYTIDILIPGLKEDPILKEPWFPSLSSLIEQTAPSPIRIDRSQVDDRVHRMERILK